MQLVYRLAYVCASQTLLADSRLDSTLGEISSFSDLKVDSGSLPSPALSSARLCHPSLLSVT